MLRAQIREAVDVALADNGYSRGFYAWKGATVTIYDHKTGHPQHAIHLPTGTSKKRLIQRLSVLSPVGKPRMLRPRAQQVKAVQLDLVEYLSTIQAKSRKRQRAKASSETTSRGIMA